MGPAQRLLGWMVVCAACTLSAAARAQDIVAREAVAPPAGAASAPGPAELPDLPWVAAGADGAAETHVGPGEGSLFPKRNAARGHDQAERDSQCENGAMRGKPCRVRWLPLLGESLLFLSAQHGGNILMDKDTRDALTHGSFWGDYAYCVQHYRWSRWNDDDPVGVDYIGHPMMGAVTSAMYEQNDPKQRALLFENTRRYWMGRMRAMAYSAAYSAQWKVGPLSEASIGNTGIGYYVRERDHMYTNETGMQDFFITPIGGMAWNVGEDALDRYVFLKLWRSRKPRAVKLLASLAMPAKAAANVARLRAPYYRELASARVPAR